MKRMRHMRRTAPELAGTRREGRSARRRAADRLVLAIVSTMAFGVARVTPAYAHMGTGLPGGFESGFRHPVSGWDHLLAMVPVPVPPVELGVAMSVLVLGLCVGLAIDPPVWAAGTIVATFAVFHGYAHGVELPSAADPVGYSVGFVLTTGLLHAFGVGIGLLTARPKGILVTRGLGAAVALAGGWYLCLALGL